jgi:hypothetical protein
MNRIRTVVEPDGPVTFNIQDIERIWAESGPRRRLAAESP